MRSILWGLCVLLLLWQAFSAEAQESALEEEIISVDVSPLQAAADLSGAQVDVGGLIGSIVRGEMSINTDQITAFVRETAVGELGNMRAQLIALVVPAILWALNRHLLGGGELSEAAGYVCFLSCACALLGMVRQYIDLTVQTLRQTSTLTAQVFPILSALTSASGAAGRAAALSPVVTLLGGTLNVFLERAARVLISGAAVTAAAGNLTERISLQGLYRLFCSAAGWVFGAIMAAFVTMLSLCGIIGSGSSGIAMKAAKYAVGTLLPVVGGDVAGTMDVMTASASAVRGAAGVTGVIVMLLLCIRPVVRLISGMLCCMLASALIEPVADGPLRRCMDQMAQVVRLLLVASSVNVVLFITLTGVICS